MYTSSSLSSFSTSSSSLFSSLLSFNLTSSLLLDQSFIILVTAQIDASLQSVEISAPTQPGVIFTISFKSISGFNLNFLVRIFKISIRASSLGTPRVISFSNRPALLKPWSILSGLVVAPITTISAPWLSISSRQADN